MICIPSTAVPLHRLPARRSARIAQIVGPADHVHRLEEFGIRGGVRIEMFRPGNPCIIRLGGSKVCLRADEAVRIMVDPA